MKKQIALLIAGIIAGTAYGQEARMSSIVLPTAAADQALPVDQSRHPIMRYEPASGPAHRTTTIGGSRWYNYGGEYQTYSLGTGAYGLTQPYMWFDTSSQDIYSGTPALAHNHLVSVGNVLDPWYSPFNDSNIYHNVIAVTAANSYTIDSLEIIGTYGRNPSTPSTVKDTFIIALTYGNGGSTSDLPQHFFTGPIAGVSGTLNFIEQLHDSLFNRATGTTVRTWNVVLDNTEVNDTDVSGTYRGGSGIYSGFFTKRVAVMSGSIPTPFAVPAGNYASVSVTFKSGDPAAPHMPPGSAGYGDTVFTGDPGSPFRYGMFRPLIVYNNVGGAIQWPAYNSGGADFNCGNFKQEVAGGWGGAYIPMWAWHNTSTGGASTYQYTTLGYKLTCASCVHTGTSTLGVNDVIKEGSVKAYPNPANNELSIAYSLSKRASVSVSIVNVLGQTVAAQQIPNTESGKVTFNTINLGAGVYTFILQADNGERTTGHVVIAH